MQKDDNPNLDCFKRALNHDGTVPYPLSVDVALEDGLAISDCHEKEIKILRLRSAVWRGDTSHAGRRLDGQCRRVFLRNAVRDAQEGTDETHLPFSPRDKLVLDDFVKVVKECVLLREYITPSISDHGRACFRDDKDKGGSSRTTEEEVGPGLEYIPEVGTPRNSINVKVFRG